MIRNRMRGFPALVAVCTSHVIVTPVVEAESPVTSYGVYLKNGECFDFSDYPAYVAAYAVCVKNTLRVGDGGNVDQLTLAYTVLDGSLLGGRIGVDGQLGCLHPDTGEFTLVHVEHVDAVPGDKETGDEWQWRKVAECPAGTRVDFFSGTYEFWRLL